MTRAQNLRKLSRSGPGKCPRCLFLKEAFTLKIIYVHSWLWHDPKSECFLKFCSLQKKCAALVLSFSYPSPHSGVHEGKGCGHQVIQGGFKIVLDGFIIFFCIHLMLFTNAILTAFVCLLNGFCSRSNRWEQIMYIVLIHSVETGSGFIVLSWKLRSPLEDCFLMLVTMYLPFLFKLHDVSIGCRTT